MVDMRPTSRNGICAQARELVRRLGLADEALSIIEAAEGGDYAQLRLVEQFLLCPDAAGIRRIIADALRPAPRPAYPFMLQPATVQKILMNRFEWYTDPLTYDPAEILRQIFHHYEYARDMQVPKGRNGADAPGKTFLARITDLLCLTAMRDLIDVIRQNRTTNEATDAVHIPPPPSSPKFRPFFKERVAAQMRADHDGLNIYGDAIKLDAWLDSSLARRILIQLFVEILFRNREYARNQPLADHEEALEAKRLWYDDLIAQGITVPELEAAIEERLRTNLIAFAQTRAELNRFSESYGDRIASLEDVGTRFALDLHQLHRMDPLLEGDRFLRLLPQYRAPMTLDAALAMLKRARPTTESLSRFRAETILLWHAGEGKALVEWLVPVVANNKSYADLAIFCDTMFAVKPSDLASKVRALAAGGTDVQPLLAAFPKDWLLEIEAITPPESPPPVEATLPAPAPEDEAQRERRIAEEEAEVLAAEGRVPEQTSFPLAFLGFRNAARR